MIAQLSLFDRVPVPPAPRPSPPVVVPPREVDAPAPPAIAAGAAVAPPASDALDQLGDEIARGLRAASDAIEGIAADLGLSVVARPPAAPELPADAPLFDRLMHTLTALNADAERQNARLEALLAELGGPSPAPEPPSRPKGQRGRGRLGKEVRGDDEVTHRELTERQRELVRGLRVDERERVYGPEGHIDDWPALKIVVETLGGDWRSGGGRGATKRPGFWVFPEDVDPRELLRVAAETGRILDPKSNDLYETPEWLADRAVDLADIRPGMRVLEPNAGRGRLALAIRRACPSAEVVCAELLDDNRAELERLGFQVVGRDFLELSPAATGLFDAVVMNPPFSKMSDARHIAHAMGFLRPGGRICAIASAALRWRSTKVVADVRALLDAHGAVWEDIPAGAFSESGTDIATCLVAATLGAAA